MIDPNTDKIKFLQVVKTTRVTILPFTEGPATNHRAKDKGKDKNSKNVNELFSIFTADIIREEVIFTR